MIPTTYDHLSQLRNKFLSSRTRTHKNVMMKHTYLQLFGDQLRIAGCTYSAKVGVASASSIDETATALSDVSSIAVIKVGRCCMIMVFSSLKGPAVSIVAIMALSLSVGRQRRSARRGISSLRIRIQRIARILCR